MLWFSHPSGWWALPALAVPLVLHLWRPPARTVRLGSLRFLRGAPRRNLRNLRWREPLLLLTRLLLLALLVLLLASPAWIRPASQVPLRWILVAAGAVINGPVLERLRTLQSAGYEIHRFSTGFPPTDLHSVATEGEPALAGSLDAWSLLREVDTTFPLHSQAAVFTPGRLSELGGIRPALRRCEVEWVQTPGRHQDDRPWIDSLRQTGNGDTAQLTACVGISNAKFTRFSSQILPARPGRTSLAGVDGRWEVEVSGGANTPSSARLLSDGKPFGGQVMSRRVPAFRVSIFHDSERGEDARYVEAAVRAIAQSEGREVIVTTDRNDPLPSGASIEHRWVFWLGTRPVPDSLARAVAAGASLITDAPLADPPRVESWMTTPVGVKAPYLPPGKIGLRRQDGLPDPATNAVWTDGFGEPVLAWSPLDRGEHWRFASRFQPAWNDLPNTGALPAMLGSLFHDPVPDQGARNARDQRIASADQGTPRTLKGGGEPRRSPPGGGRTDLTGFLWAAALLCFCAERWLSRLPVARSAPVVPAHPNATGPLMEAIRS